MSTRLPGQPPPLDMARNLVAAIQRSAEFIDADPLGARIGDAGSRSYAAAELAFRLAVVSIAEDFHRIADVVCRFDAWADTNDDAIANARATREHMRRWAEGDDDHQGEKNDGET